MAFANNNHPVCLNCNSHLGNIDRKEYAAIFSCEHAAGFHGLPVPAIKAKDPIGLRYCVPTLDIGELAAIGRSPYVTVIEVAPQRLKLFR